jgi:exosortase D (VPLPA-CTERM-specific)
MSQQASQTSRVPASESGNAVKLIGYLSLTTILAAATFIFWRPVGWLFSAWINSPEANYGPIVPPIALLIVLRELSRAKAPVSGGGIGAAIACFGILVGLISFIGPYVFAAQLGLVIFIIGLVVALVGERRGLAVWPGLAYLIFGVPLAGALLASVTLGLQFISSELGVMIIRAMAIPVFLEGNVIDLGVYKLQVAEACSGLRYVLPLASFAFLCAYLFSAPLWQRVVLFLTSIPIAIGMNSVRIALTAVFVNAYGISAAEGFLHGFEGWIIFCACIMVLALEMQILSFFGGGRNLLARLDASLAFPKWNPGELAARAQRMPVLFILVVSVALASVALVLRQSDPTYPDRVQFSEFPYKVGKWTATDAPIDEDSIDALRATDFLSRNYWDGEPGTAGATPVNVWVAYYAAQGNRDAIHSPLICIPGGGWAIEKSDTVTLTPDQAGGAGIVVNRLVISKSGARQLVYYWFRERGRNEASEYWMKWYTLVDAVAMRRTDGALVRFVVPLDNDPAGAEAGEQKLQAFIGEILPQFNRFVPGALATAGQ